ncbi:oxidoreductase, short chain dehydrogenase/reductase family [Hydrogenimonas sp.]|nr:oxidoreductase, short chain dehydrogenase/reductase family [Hydrogenimonas sp.]
MKPERVVLVTGSGSGMGRESVRFLAQKGFKVYAATRYPEKLAGVFEGDVTVIPLDVADPGSVEEAFGGIERLDVLVNNAGYGLVSTVEDMDEKQMFDQFNVNVFGVLRVTKHAIPLMRRERSGVIVNISSFLGKIGLPLLTMYNATKYAVEGVTDSLRYELSDFNIRVHSIMPGFFDTRFARENLVTNAQTFDAKSPYAQLVSNLAPQIVEQINRGNDAKEVAELIYRIIEDEKFPARVTAGDKASKFIPMRKELSDEDFERRVREYYNL